MRLDPNGCENIQSINVLKLHPSVLLHLCVTAEAALPLTVRVFLLVVLRADGRS